MSNEKHRALIALDVSGTAIVLATDSRCIAGDAEAIGTTCAEDIGLCSNRKVGPGLWLWEGVVQHYPRGESYDDTIEYNGTLRAVTNMVEAVELFTMAPPETPEDDRESPEA